MSFHQETLWRLLKNCVGLKQGAYIIIYETFECYKRPVYGSAYSYLNLLPFTLFKVQCNGSPWVSFHYRKLVNMTDHNITSTAIIVYHVQCFLREYLICVSFTSHTKTRSAELFYYEAAISSSALPSTETKGLKAKKYISWRQTRLLPRKTAQCPFSYYYL